MKHHLFALQEHFGGRSYFQKINSGVQMWASTTHLNYKQYPGLRLDINGLGAR